MCVCPEVLILNVRRCNFGEKTGIWINLFGLEIQTPNMPSLPTPQVQSRLHAHEDPADPLRPLHTGTVFKALCQHSGYGQCSSVHYTTSIAHMISACKAITKPPLLQESRLTGGGSSIGCVLVECKVSVECELEAAINFHSFHP